MRFEPTYPQLADRIQSTFIDTVLVIILMFAAASIMDKFDNVPNWVRILVFIALFIVYEPLCMSLGSTLGNYLKGIRVRKESDPSKKANIIQALVRYPIKVLLGWISFLTIGANPQRRAIHDLASGTVMIKLNKQSS